MDGMIMDVHAHILPGVDDGAGSMEESLRLLELAWEQGIGGIIATPHCSGKGTADRVRGVMEELKAAARRRVPEMMLWLGQEQWYREELVSQLEEGESLTLAGGRHVLVEFHPSSGYSQIVQGIRMIAGSGYIPVVAHVERYSCLRSRGLGGLRDMGCLLQMNYKSLDGGWLQEDVRWCRKQVKDGMIDVLGTDMHRTDFRPPDIRGAVHWLERHVSREQLWNMTRNNPLSIIQ